MAFISLANEVLLATKGSSQQLVRSSWSWLLTNTILGTATKSLSSTLSSFPFNVSKTLCEVEFQQKEHTRFRSHFWGSVSNFPAISGFAFLWLRLQQNNESYSKIIAASTLGSPNQCYARFMPTWTSHAIPCVRSPRWREVSSHDLTWSSDLREGFLSSATQVRDWALEIYR